MFRFALEPLLQRRRAAEDALRARYALAARDEMLARRAQSKLDAALRDAYRGRPARAGDLADIDAALLGGSERIRRAGIACGHLRRALIDAARARRALELLRERRLTEYRRQRRRREERELGA